MGPELWVIFLIIGVIVLFLWLFFTFIPITLWISAVIAKAKIGIPTLVSMRLRRIPPGRIVNPQIKAVKAGLHISTNKLEAHYLVGGNIDRVVNALIAAQRANLTLDFEQAAAIDLAGRDVFEAVQICVNPKVIETPAISAITKNGVELIIKVKITVKADIGMLVGGAGESTIIARMSESIISTVGSLESLGGILENPDSISGSILKKELDSGTAFKILSIDITNIDIGRNIGVQMQADQAAADKRITQAKADERRAIAVAVEQERRSQVQEMRVKVVEAEAEVQKAMIKALQDGNLGVIDYYNMMNAVSNTQKRNSITDNDEKKES
jgi:uncharacterized protein YqfA (UPF0365 family)